MAESSPAELTVAWTAHRTPDGRYVGEITIPLIGPLSGGTMIASVKALHPDAAAALHNPMTVIDNVLQNPLVAALAPPGAPLAVMAAKTLLDGCRTGRVHEALAAMPPHLHEAAASLLAKVKEHMPHVHIPHIPGISGPGYGYPYGYGTGY
jgi:hypothetical protein